MSKTITAIEAARLFHEGESKDLDVIPKPYGLSPAKFMNLVYAGETAEENADKPYYNEPYEATYANVKAARDGGARWNRIAAATGESIAKVRDIFESRGTDSKTDYAGKGRKYEGHEAAEDAGRRNLKLGWSRDPETGEVKNGNGKRPKKAEPRPANDAPEAPASPANEEEVIAA